MSRNQIRNFTDTSEIVAFTTWNGRNMSAPTYLQICGIWVFLPYTNNKRKQAGLAVRLIRKFRWIFGQFCSFSYHQRITQLCRHCVFWMSSGASLWCLNLLDERQNCPGDPGSWLSYWEDRFIWSVSIFSNATISCWTSVSILFSVNENCWRRSSTNSMVGATSWLVEDAFSRANNVARNVSDWICS